MTSNNNPAPRTLQWTPVKFDPLKWVNDTVKIESKSQRVWLDIYFQPALTKTEDGIHGIGLLFLENSMRDGVPASWEKGGLDDTDFDDLAQALLLWAVYAYDPEFFTPKESPPLTSGMLKELYESFVTNAGSKIRYKDLKDFLHANFIFRIGTLSTPKSCALFPMFPELRMQPGNSTSISFEDNKRTAEYIQEYKKSLKVNHGGLIESSKNTNQPASDQSEESSVAQFIFVDYVALLIRASIQYAIEYLEDHKIPSITLVELLKGNTEKNLPGLNGGGQFNHLAGMTSRFMLHGLRLPDLDGDGEPEPLYKATGQQFPIPKVPQKDYGITLSTPSKLDWLIFLDPKGTLDVNLLEEWKEFKSLDITTEKPELMPFYMDEPKRFILRQKIAWGTKQLRELPADLQAYLSTKKNGVSLSLSLKVNPTSTDKIEEVIWLTKVRVTIRRVSKSDGNGLLPNTYLMAGTDEPGKDLLEEILCQSKPPTVEILYGVGNGAGTAQESRTLVSQKAAETYLLKTNLSTQNTPYTAKLTDTKPFIQLILEASTVSSAGYYLYTGHEKLPDEIFADGQNATLVLLIGSGEPNNHAHSFHNCVEILSRDDDVFAEVDNADKLKILSLPPGNLGFRLKRKPDSNDLNNLYQLLGYQLKDGGQFPNIPHQEGLPIGPASDDNDDKAWIYERVIPVYAYAAHNGNSDNGALPPAELNPYAGISPSAKIGLECFWQDVYGNRFSDTPDFEEDFDVRYFDPLLGINQWPSVVESYTFTRSESNSGEANLIIELRLDQSKYLPAPGTLFEEIKDKIKADREAYKYIYYQVQQPDLTFKIHTSVLPEARHIYKAAPANSNESDKRFFTDFVDTVYKYLSTLEQLELHTHTVGEGETLQGIADDYHVSVRALGEANKDIPKLFEPGTLQVPVEHKIMAGDTLEKIATKLISTNEADSTEKVRQIIQNHAEITGLLRVDHKIEALNYTIQMGDTLERLAGFQLASTEANTSELLRVGVVIELDAVAYTIKQGDTLTSLTEAINQAANTDKTVVEIVHSIRDLNKVFQEEILTDKILEVGQTLQDIEGLLVMDVLLSVHGDYITQTGDSLTSIAKSWISDHTNQNLIAADIAEQNPEVSLNSSVKLYIADRVIIASGLPAVTKTAANQSLAVVTTLINNDFSGKRIDGTVSVADVAIANQNVLGLISAQDQSVELMAAFLQFSNITDNHEQLLQTLSQSIPAPALKQILDTLTIRKNETFYTLRQLFEDTLNDLQKEIKELLAKTDKNIESHKNELQAILDQINQRLRNRLTVADLANAISDITFLVAGKTLIVPPFRAQKQIPLPSDTGGYPPEIIFPVSVQIDTRRDPDDVGLIHETVKDVPEVQSITAYLSPKMAPITAKAGEGGDQTNSLRPFALEFQDAFQGLRLAVGEERSRNNPNADDSNSQANKSVWAVHLGKTGVDYNINEIVPYFFTPAPLANTLLSDTVDIYTYDSKTWILDTKKTEKKRFDAIDINVLARDFLRAVEDFLKPETAIPAMHMADGGETSVVNKILGHKATLAEAISNQVKHILALRDNANNDELKERRNVAADTLKQELLINLADAYDIETIIQYNVDVTNDKNRPWRKKQGEPIPEVAPRLAGQPVILEAKDTSSGKTIDLQSLDFTLSPAKVPLTTAGSNLTFFFNTQTPERYEDITLNLTYRTNELEYDITPLEDFKNYQASSWLSFILPLGFELTKENLKTLEDLRDSEAIPQKILEKLKPLTNQDWSTEAEFVEDLEKDLGTSLRESVDQYKTIILKHINPNHIGDVEIPIPLRTFPMPPSLVLQRAEPDPDSLEHLPDVRQWQYVYTYEHLDVAQDTIESGVLYNVEKKKNEDSRSEPDIPANLLKARTALFSALVNFSTLYPQLLPDLQALAEGKPGDDQKKNAVKALGELIDEVATSWNSWAKAFLKLQKPEHDNSTESATYEIDEEIPADNPSAKEIIITLASLKALFPKMKLPGYWQESTSMAVAISSVKDSDGTIVGARLISGGWDQIVRQWNLTSDPSALTFPIEDNEEMLPISSLALSPDGKTLALGTWAQKVSEENKKPVTVPVIRLWTLGNHGTNILATLTATLEDHTNQISSVAFSSDGKTLASGSYDGTMRLWKKDDDNDTWSPTELDQDSAEPDPVMSVAFSPDGKTLASGSQSGQVRLWLAPFATVPSVVLTGHTNRVTSVAFSPDGKTLASGSWDTDVRLWTLPEQADPDALLPADPAALLPLCKLWAQQPPDVTRVKSRVLKDHSDRVASVAFHQTNNHILASGSWDRRVRIWELDKPGIPSRALLEPGRDVVSSHRTAVSSVAFSPDGTTLISSSWDRAVRRWTLPAESTAVVDLFTEAGNEKPTVKYNFIRKDRAEAALEPVYGESDIPDRTLIIQDLDIIQSQNAWGGIWLTRNKHLVSTNETNPEFIFQTPQVRFSNPTTPLIVNDRRWDIATLGSPDGKPQKRGLDKHIEALFRTLLTPAATRPFVIRIGCGYAFALATGGNTDLLSNLPVLLSTQFPIPAQAAADSTSIGDLRKNLVEAISKWRGEFKPSTNKAMYNLKISIFSHQDNGGQYNSPNLPLLQLERLYLMLKDVK